MSEGEPTWIEFRELDPKPKTKCWGVFPKDSRFYIGRVQWYAHWRKYCFMPDIKTVWEERCLRDIANFCEQQTKLHRENKATK